MKTSQHTKKTKWKQTNENRLRGTVCDETFDDEEVFELVDVEDSSKAMEFVVVILEVVVTFHIFHIFQIVYVTSLLLATFEEGGLFSGAGGGGETSAEEFCSSVALVCEDNLFVLQWLHFLLLRLLLIVPPTAEILSLIMKKGQM
uniref:Uncharacterized protein n=1 Tax=Glossina pallidipes TaxID=7398 RepID=A0A1B0AJG4_GLOPL